MPTLTSILKTKPSAKVDAGLAVVGLLVFSAGFGSWASIVVMGALAVLWRGRPLGMAALFALAISAAAHVSACRSASDGASSSKKAVSAEERCAPRSARTG